MARIKILRLVEVNNGKNCFTSNLMLRTVAHHLELGSSVHGLALPYPISITLFPRRDICHIAPIFPNADTSSQARWLGEPLLAKKDGRRANRMDQNAVQSPCNVHLLVLLLLPRAPHPHLYQLVPLQCVVQAFQKRFAEPLCPAVHHDQRIVLLLRLGPQRVLFSTRQLGLRLLAQTRIDSWVF